MLPVALDLKVLRAGVAGSGPAAQRRLALLAEAGAEGVVVFDPDGDMPGGTGMPAVSRIEARLPGDDDLDTLDVLFIADLPGEVAGDLAARARAAKVLVNTEDVLALCDFHVPALVRRGALVLSVSTGGASPGLARRLRRHLAALFGPEWAARVDEIAAARARWRAEGLSMADVAARTDALIDEKGWLA